jgi:DNA-binding transcriptional LysR family regulator
VQSRKCEGRAMRNIGVKETHSKERRAVRTGRPPRECAGEVDARILDAPASPRSRNERRAASVDEIACLATGRFLTILPESLLHFPVRRTSFKVLPVDLPTTRGPTSIMTLKNRQLSPVAQLFIECAREIAKPLGKKK